jgi:hypothetical protein
LLESLGWSIRPRRWRMPSAGSRGLRGLPWRHGTAMNGFRRICINPDNSQILCIQKAWLKKILNAI